MPKKINYPVQGLESAEIEEMLAMFDPGELVAQTGHVFFDYSGTIITL